MQLQKNNCFILGSKYLCLSMIPTSSHIVRSEVAETSFGFYSDEEIKKMSYCKITSPLTHDALGNPLQG